MLNLRKLILIQTKQCMILILFRNQIKENLKCRCTQKIRNVSNNLLSQVMYQINKHFNALENTYSYLYNLTYFSNSNTVLSLDRNISSFISSRVVNVAFNLFRYAVRCITDVVLFNMIL